eukprot:gene26399-biopygen16280
MSRGGFATGIEVESKLRIPRGARVRSRTPSSSSSETGMSQEALSNVQREAL